MACREKAVLIPLQKKDGEQDISYFTMGLDSPENARNMITALSGLVMFGAISL